MDKKFEHPNQEFWRSVNEYYNGRSALENHLDEFPDTVKEEFDVKSLSSLSRRQFLALLGASSAFAMTACNDYRDQGEIISYNKKPEYSNFGDAIYFASSLNDGTSILIKTREGRPIKVDGNPDNPIIRGKTTTQAQASIMNLYDPARLKHPFKKSNSPLILNKDDLIKTDWETVDVAMKQALEKATLTGKEIAIITHSVISPTQNKLFEDFIAKYPTTKIYSYDLHSDKNKRIAWEKSYGNYNYPSIKWEQANIILSLESDFLGNEGNIIENIRGFSSRRDVEKINNFNRLYIVESGLSLTGINADYRFRLSPEYQYDFVIMLFKELLDVDKSPVSNALSLTHFADKYGLSEKKLAYLIKDLKENKGKSIIIAGEKLPVEIHLAVNMLNDLLGNNALYDFSKLNILQRKYSNLQDFENLISRMNKSEVEVLIHFDSNPVFHLPFGDLYLEALKRVKTVVSMLDILNESSKNNHFILPINSPFESWNDFEIKTGLLTLQQPVIAPLYNTRQKEAILLNWLSDDPKMFSEDIYHKYLMNRWRNEVYPLANSSSKFEKFWYSCLHDGFLVYDYKFEIPKLISSNVPELKLQKKEYTLVLNRNYGIGDGRNANNGWLQEVPHPITKAAWDNYAAISPISAKELGLDNNDVILIEVNNRKVELPVMLQPGTAEKVICVETGYGRSVTGDVGKDVGVNVHPLISTTSLSEWIVTGVKVTKTNKKYQVYSSQEHHPLDEDFVKDFHFSRDIIKEGTVEKYKKDKKFLKHNKHEIESINPLREYKGVKWAMAIDLNKCVSCNNCVISCNVENNVPVVGKEQYGKGREMHWIRIDRYYSGTPGEPKVSLQPMLCQHCDHAPCENVCPVVATNHSDDGLNQMTYNRCVGTRYCSNNCPYKVRRFNFFNFRSHFANGYYEQDSTALMHNPEVTVRSRGVMEKCTFCIQRIMEARQEAIKEGRQLRGEDVKTACQVACPAEAITFGDMNSKDSEIAKKREHDLGYYVLEELNIRPNVTYIAKLRNIYTEDE